MQDLLLAQKRRGPAYCFQHLDLDTIPRQRLREPCRASTTLAPRHDVVACFEPKWNSLDVNKTRSFSILGGLHGAGMRSFAALVPSAPSSLALNPAHEEVKFS